MHKVKSHKSVEQIAKKHRLDVSFIQNQLDMGEPIEHEHTKDHDLATDIALQHLDEIPDYYTRLKKMEASAKKSHKKYKDVTEAKKMKGEDPCWKGYEMIGKKKKNGKEVPNCVPVKEETGMVRYCPKCKKDETRSECRYGEKYWDMFSIPSALTSNQLKYDPNRPHPTNEEKDHEYSMARSELSTIISAAKRLQKKMKGEGNIEAWVQSKITKAADYIDTAADYLESGEHKVDESTMVQDSTGNDYVEFIDIIKPQPLKPSKGIGSALIGEKCWDEYEQKGMKKKGKKLVPNCVKKEEYSNWRDELIISEKWEDKLKNMTPDQIENLKKSNPGAAEKIDAMRKQAKSATPKPVGSGSQLPNAPKPPTTQNRGQNLRDPRAQDRMTAARRQGSQNVAAAQAKRAAKPSLLKTLSKVKNPRVAIPLAIAGGIYGLLTAPKKQQKENYSNWRSDFGLTEDWQSVNRKDKTDGLSQKAVNAYRRENPGSKLQTAVTKKNPTGKDADRQDAFCRRMSGMKDKLTSAKTARDPDSRINKALRRWNCN